MTSFRVTKLNYFDLLKLCNATDVPRWIMRARKHFVVDDAKERSLKVGKMTANFWMTVVPGQQNTNVKTHGCQNTRKRLTVRQDAKNQLRRWTGRAPGHQCMGTVNSWASQRCQDTRFIPVLTRVTITSTRDNLPEQPKTLCIHLNMGSCHGAFSWISRLLILLEQMGRCQKALPEEPWEGY